MSDERRHSVEDLFHAARELSTEERSKFLDQECATDPIARSTIETLLREDARAHGPLDGVVTDSLATTLSPGMAVGPYEVVSVAGIGGMGQVYRAVDRRLKRDVAIKALPVEFTRDRERLQRLQGEATVLASLNNPNVAAIYDVLEREDEPPCLVLEFVPGATLAEALKDGPFEIEKTLKIAHQIATALEAAHNKGIIHRDLKPSNIKTTPEGMVKILDFGLATVLVDGDTRPPYPRAGFGKPASTYSGLAGTPSYMSPEQAQGLPVDQRTDIWAFGCVLYEMLTGRKAFDESSVSETLSSVFEEEPDWTLLPEETPLEVHRLLHKCLEKDLTRRCQRASDLRREIEELKERQHHLSLLRSNAGKSGRRRWVTIGAVTATALAGLFVILDLRRTGDLRVEQTRHSTSAQTLSRGDVPDVMPSPPAPTSPPPVNRANLADRAAPTTQSGPDGNPVRASKESVTSDDSAPTIVDTLYFPTAIALDVSGNIYIADSDGGRIFKVTTSGMIFTIAGTGTPGFGGDGGPATLAQLMGPFGLAVDTAGNVYVSDYYNRRIRKVTDHGIMTTVAGNGGNGFAGDGGPAMSAQLTFPRGIAHDRAGNLYFADSTRLRKVTPDGVISTVASGFDSAGNMWGLAANEAGDVFLADNVNSRVLRVTPNGIISTVAGNGTAGFSGDGGPATSAQLDRPQDVALDRAGNLFIADRFRVRKVTPAGIISTFAGGGARGINGDAGLATSAWVAPNRLAADATGNIYILQSLGSRQTVLKVVPDGRISTVVAWRGDVLPIRVGQHGLKDVQISTAAMLRFDGDTIYSQGTPQFIINEASRVDATVSFNPGFPLRSNCQVTFEISNAESPTKAELSEQGTPPSVRITGELKPGLHNLVTRLSGDGPRCGVELNGARAVLRYVVTVTPR